MLSMNSLSIGELLTPAIRFECAIDTKSRKFQCKVLNRILPFNDFVFKIGKSESSLCTFSHTTEKSMPRLFFQCSFVQHFCRLIQPIFEVIQFLKLMLFLVSLDHLKIRFFIITFSYSRNSIFTVVNLRMLYRQNLYAMYVVKAVFEMDRRRIGKERNKLSFHQKNME